jgi:mycothiol synthase
MPSTVRSRPYRSDDADWWRVRDLLVATHTGSPPSWNWDVRRWDGLRFHREDPRLPAALADGIGLWETRAGRLVGAVHGEGGAGEAFLELDPDHRSLEPEMLEWAERRLAASDAALQRLDLPTWDYDLPRRQLLEARGYRALEQGGWLRRLSLGAWRIPRQHVSPPYGVATTTDASAALDASRMATLLNAAFGRTIHTAAEYATFMRRSPSFRHDLNLVALAPDGSFAAHVGLTWDGENRHGIFEPVCTHPDHRRHGLARALMLEGLRRLHALGARTASVETGDMLPANALYAGTGFTEEYRFRLWRHEWAAPMRTGSR